MPMQKIPVDAIYIKAHVRAYHWASEAMALRAKGELTAAKMAGKKVQLWLQRIAKLEMRGRANRLDHSAISASAAAGQLARLKILCTSPPAKARLVINAAATARMPALCRTTSARAIDPTSMCLDSDLTDS